VQTLTIICEHDTGFRSGHAITATSWEMSGSIVRATRTDGRIKFFVGVVRVWAH
jgi:hypothetical protein